MQNSFDIQFSLDSSDFYTHLTVLPLLVLTNGLLYVRTPAGVWHSGWVRTSRKAASVFRGAVILCMGKQTLLTV